MTINCHNCVQNVGGTASVIRGDMGTENVRITAIQRYLRHEGGDSWSGEKSFLYGRSVVNQRIEAWLDNCEEELLIGGLLILKI